MQRDIGITLKDAVDGYLAERRGRGLTAGATLRWGLRHFLLAVETRLGREPLAVEVLREDLDAALCEGLAKGHSTSTRFHTAVNVRLLFRWLFSKGILLVDPTADLTLKNPPRPLHFIPSREQIERLLELAMPEEALLRAKLDAAKPGRDEDLSCRERVIAEALRERAVLELLYGSGLRMGEARKLDVSDLRLAERTLLVRQAKGKKDRLVPITKASALALSRYLAQGREVLASQRTSKAPWTAHEEKAALFVTISGSRLGSAWQRFSLAPLFSLAGLPAGCGPHRLRHACALHLLESGAPILVISRLLGHASLQSTTIYLRLSTESLRRTLLLCHPREK